MRGWRLLFLALTSALAVAAPAHAGKKVPSAEQGTVPLLADTPIGLDQAIVVRPGETAWREQLRPEKNVRLLASVEPRSRPRAPGVAQGALLFGYRLSSGVAYCPASDPDLAISRVQCFRDFDQDGRFDGGYVTTWEDSGSRYLAGYVHALGASGRIPYERVDAALAPTIEGRFDFVGFRKGQPRFRLMVEDSRMDNLSTCEPAGDGTCQIGGLTLRITPEGEAARITLLAAADRRQFQITMSGASIAGRPR